MNEKRFKMKVAKHVVEIDAMYHLIGLQCKDFFVKEEKPEFLLKTTQEELDYELQLFRMQYGGAEPSGVRLEVTLILRRIAEQYIDYNILLMHGAAISVDNRAFLFIGNSGIGKTTHILKWCEHIQDAVIVNGDKPFIIAENKPMVCGTPWAGKEQLYTNTIVPIDSIIILERATNNKIYRLNYSEAFLSLYQQVYRPEDISKMLKTLDLLKSLRDKVNFWKFQFNNYKSDCFQVAYDALVKNNKK